MFQAYGMIVQKKRWTDSRGSGDSPASFLVDDSMWAYDYRNRQFVHAVSQMQCELHWSSLELDSCSVDSVHLVCLTVFRITLTDSRQSNVMDMKQWEY